MLDQILVVVGITVLIMISPGPDMVIVMRNTMIGGRVAGLNTSAGVLAGNLVHIAYCAVGIGWLISQSILAFTLLKYAAAAYLIYLGLMSLRDSGKTIDLSAARVAIRAGPVRPGFHQQYSQSQGHALLSGLLHHGDHA